MDSLHARSPPTHAARREERKRLLFVADDLSPLDRLRDALRPYRNRWEMRFATSGDAALALLAEAECDVVVSDLRMPQMDGARLLAIVRDRCPGAVRIVLSGHADVQMVTRAATAAHRLVAKPCETEALARVIERSCGLQDLAAQVELNRHTMGASALPSVPRVCMELAEVLAAGTASASDVARIIEQDMAMAAKVLQLANSAYFGRRTPVSQVSDAVAYVGLDALRALALQAAAVQEFRVEWPIPGFDLDELQRHGARVARLSAVIGSETGVGKEVFAAGLLHDVGLLVMASQDGPALARVIATARETARPVPEIERECFGLTHGEIGAHLLALWGLPHTITEAVAGHHRPDWLALPVDAVAVVYLASTIVEELEAIRLPQPLRSAPLDTDWVKRAGVSDAIRRWRTLAEREFFATTGSG